MASHVTVRPLRRVRGRVRVPGDKSIAHRYALLAAIADGASRIGHYAPGADCQTTLACLRALGVAIDAGTDAGASTLNEVASQTVRITGCGLIGLAQPEDVLDAENSGTTLRLLAGILAAHPFETTITGDASLRRRPMARLIAPLERMGARIEAERGRPPLKIRGAALTGIEHTPEVPSAQVKSAVLLAGLLARGVTRVHEPVPTRNHTELALAAFGAPPDIAADGTIAVEGGRRLQGLELDVPGDISSAAFWCGLAAALPDSDVEIVDVGLNPTRTAILDALRRVGARIDVTLELERAGEPRGRIRVRHGGVGALALGAADVPALIDELPLLAAVAAHGGELTVTGASELRVKESDRISALVRGLRALGVDVDELPDGFHVSHVRGGRRLRGGTADAAGDHRLAMAFAVAAAGAEGPSSILAADSVAVSYPGFFDVLGSLAA